MAKIPRIQPNQVQPTQTGQGFRPTPNTAVQQAASNLGQAVGQSAQRISNQQLRELRFESVLQAKEDKANRNQVLRKAQLGLKDETFALQNSLLEDTEPETLVARTEKQIGTLANSYSSKITNIEDRDIFNLRAQALGQSVILNARQISKQKILDSGLAEGFNLQDQTLREFSANPNISDEDFAAGVQAIDEYYTDLVKNAGLKKEVKERITRTFDDKLGGIVREQDETLAIESGSHTQLLNHLVRVQSGFYQVAPEDVPGIIEQAIARQSKFLNAKDVAAGKLAIQREKDFRIATDLEDLDALSKLLGRPVSQAELDNNLKGLVLEGFRKGIVQEPATVDAAEAEIDERIKHQIDLVKAAFTESLVKSTKTKEVNLIIDDLVSNKAKKIFAGSQDGPEARRELLKEAAAKLDKLINASKEGRTKADQILKKEIQLAERSLDALKTVGFLNLGTKNENQKIAFMKQILHLRVQQGQKPFDVVADLITQFPKSPAKAAGTTDTPSREQAIPFRGRINVLKLTAPLTANEFDDQELKELIRFHDEFIDKAQSITDRNAEDQAIKDEQEEQRRLEEQNSFMNQFKNLIPQ